MVYPPADPDLPLFAAIGALITSVGSDGFAPALRRLLDTVLRLDTLVITRYPPAGPPHCLFHDLDDLQAAITVDFYASGPYLLDPFYLACRDGRGGGPFLLRDLVTPAFLRSEYYRRFYRRTRLRDELGIMLADGAAGWIGLSLGRSARRQAFADTDTAALRRLMPVLSAAVLRHWGGAALAETAGQALAEDRLSQFGADLLTPREAEVIQLVLQGHSTPGISALLGLAEGTVKVHRRHAYARLGISSQAELFSQATRYLASGADRPAI